MKKLFLMLIGVLAAFPALARDFTYTYQGQTLTYTVLDEAAKTCETKQGSYPTAGNNITGGLVIPSIAKDDDTEYTVISISNWAFYNCTGLTSVTIPNSVQTIGESAFAYCSGLTELTIPNSVQTIGWSAFWGCTGLTDLTIPNSITSIGNYAFYSCTGLTEVTIPNSVQTIGDYAFCLCTDLTSVTIGDSVISIGEGAFYGCTGLTEVTIPNSVQTIGNYAFWSCTGLRSVYYLAEEPISANTDCFSDDTYSNATLYVSEVAVDKCKEIDPWKNFKNISGIAGIEEVTIDADENLPCEVYNLNGVKVSDSTDNLPAGLYIIRQGKSVKKIAVK